MIAKVSKIQPQELFEHSKAPGCDKQVDHIVDSNLKKHLMVSIWREMHLSEGSLKSDTAKDADKLDQPVYTAVRDARATTCTLWQLNPGRYSKQALKVA